jgi:hypothetical protein
MDGMRETVLRAAQAWARQELPRRRSVATEDTAVRYLLHLAAYEADPLVSAHRRASELFAESLDPGDRLTCELLHRAHLDAVAVTEAH